MVLNVEVAANKFADNLADDALATAIEAWLDGLSITTIYNCTIVHYQGFWRAVVVYV
jgi:hypothetical protein